MKTTIELYGRLREAGFGPGVEIELPDGATASQALAALRAAFGAKAALLEGAALASEQAVLAPGEKAQGARLAALPPVCGG